MICRRCGQDKVAGEFIWKPNGKIARGQKCKICVNETIYNTPEFKAGQRNRNLIRAYGISSEEYNTLLIKQNGKCAICSQESDAKGKNAGLHVDHDHKTERVRGLLCYRCNIAIGFLDEDSDRIYKIMDYLNFHLMNSLKID